MATLHPLTSLRFFAALAVLLLHASCLTPDPVGLGTQFYVGTSAVTFFFVLSGFILCYNYRHSFDCLEGGAVRKFWLARWARIFPLHLLAFILILGATWDGLQLLDGKFGSPFSRAIANLSMMHGYGPVNWRSSYNDPSWSLSVEWTCYLCFPFLIFGLASGRWKWILAVSVFASAGWLWAQYRLVILGSAHHEVGLFISSPWVRIFDFLIGCLVAMLFCHRQKKSAFEVKAVRSSWLWTLAETGSLSILGAFVAFAQTRSIHDMTALNWNGYYLPIFCLMIWVFAHGKGTISSALSNRMLVRLGEASFALYMLHAVPLAWFKRWNLMNEINMTHFGFFVGFIVAMIGISLLVHRNFEIPMRDWIRGRAKQMKSIQPETSLRQAA